MSFETGRITVDVSGIPLTTGQPERADVGVQIYSSSGNTADVFVGTWSGVTADSNDSTDGYPISPNTSLLVADRDPNDIFVISALGPQKLWYIIV